MEKERGPRRSVLDKVCLNYIQSLDPFKEYSLDQLCVLGMCRNLLQPGRKAVERMPLKSGKWFPAGKETIPLSFWSSPNIQLTDCG